MKNNSALQPQHNNFSMFKICHSYTVVQKKQELPSERAVELK